MSGSQDAQSPIDRVVAPRAMPGEPAEFIQITFQMMKKGHVIKRGRQTFRQIGVTVDGSTRLVTSGDTVDRDTYEALLRAGIINVSATGDSAPPIGE